MHRIERNILHHAKQNRELRKYLKYSYEFYLEHCVDESKNEIPLSYLEWKLNHGKEEQRELIVKLIKQ